MLMYLNFWRKRKFAADFAESVDVGISVQTTPQASENFMDRQEITIDKEKMEFHWVSKL